MNSSTPTPIHPQPNESDQAAIAVLDVNIDEVSQGEQHRSKSPSLPQSHDNNGPSRIAPTEKATASNDIIVSVSEDAITIATTQQQQQLQLLLKDNASLKDKVNKLKDLLAKSSKATRDIKAELETQKSALEKAHSDNQRLNIQVHVLSKRPTHLDWMVDFEKNVERALWNVHNQNHQYQSQSGGEDPSSFSSDIHNRTNSRSISKSNPLTDASEEDDANTDSTTFENQYSTQSSNFEQDNQDQIHNALLDRIAILEEEKQALLIQQTHDQSMLTELQTEIQNTKIEAERATQSMKEMQLEINLITQSAMNANARAAKGREAVEHLKCDKARIHELRNQVTALMEWALAATAAKEVLLEKNVQLEHELALRNNSNNNNNNNNNNNRDEQMLQIPGRILSSSFGERILSTHSSSVVIGAGMCHKEFLDFGKHRLEDNETVVLRWRFDVIPQDLDICFSLVRGKCNDICRISDTEFIIRERMVHGGAGGENEGVFTVNNTTTLIFSNEKAWVRPRAVNLTLETLAVI